MSGYKYECVDCRVTMSTDVKPVSAPVHPCPRHAKKIRPLTEVPKE